MESPDFPVSVGEGVIGLTNAAPGNPAQDAVRAEVEDIATNPHHPMHAGYHRTPMDPRVDAHLAKLYGTPPAPVDIVDGVSVSAGEREPAAEAEDFAAEDARDMADFQSDCARDGLSYEAGLAEATELGKILFTADPALAHEAERRLGGAMGLRILRLLRQRVNL